MIEESMLYHKRKINKQNNHSKITNKIEQIIKIFSCFGIISYIIGFIVHQIYLSQFGISANDFFKVKYILTGIIFLLIFSPAIVISILTTKDKRKYFKIFMFIILNIFHIFFIWGIFYGLTHSYCEFAFGNTFSSTKFTATYYSLLVINWAPWIIIANLFIFFMFYMFLKEPGVFKKASIFVLPLFLVILIIIFERSIFGFIPSQVGGGNPILVSPFFKDKELERSIKRYENFQLYLIDQRNNEYVLLLKTKHTNKIFVIPKESIYLTIDLKNYN